MKAGPRNGQIRGTPRVFPSSEARAARATAASPGRTLSTPSPFTGCVAEPPGAGSIRSVLCSPTLRSGLFIGRLPADPHAARQLRAERMRPSGDLDHQRATERLAGIDQQAVSRLDLVLREVAQHRPVSIRDPREHPALARLEIDKRNRLLNGEREVAIGNRIAVRV